eukprot:Gb_39104 [translate_table: standard]
MDTINVGMHVNWYGVLGKNFKHTFGHTINAILSGFVGMDKSFKNGVPYSLTKEFIGVYWMLILMPDKLIIRGIHETPQHNKTPPMLKKVDLLHLIGIARKVTLSNIGNER